MTPRTNWTAIGSKLDAKAKRSAIAKALSGQVRTIAIGRSRNSAAFSNATPIQIVDGFQAPELRGQPYLSTTFRRGSFTKNLYTPSTLHVVVGSGWLANK